MQQALKKKQKEKQPKEEMNTLDIPMGEEEVLGPTPPEHHHHMSQDVCHKVDVLNWLANNRDDPALKVRK